MNGLDFAHTLGAGSREPSQIGPEMCVYDLCTIFTICHLRQREGKGGWQEIETRSMAYCYDVVDLSLIERG